MSLYNMLHGYNDNALLAMTMLDLTPDDVGRFRDAFFTEDGKIAVFTRNGGGNRDDYQYVFDELSKHPMYLEDFDDDFDCTYATIMFSVPEQYKPLVDKLKPNKKEPSLKEKTDNAIESIGEVEFSRDESEQLSAVERVEKIVRAAVEGERQEKPRDA